VDGPYRCTTHPSHGAHLGHQPHGKPIHLCSKHTVDCYHCVQRLAASSHQQSCEAMEDGFSSGGLDQSEKAPGYLQLDSRSFDHCSFSTTDTKLQILCLTRLDKASSLSRFGVRGRSPPWRPYSNKPGSINSVCVVKGNPCQAINPRSIAFSIRIRISSQKALRPSRWEQRHCAHPRPLATFSVFRDDSYRAIRLATLSTSETAF